MSETKYTLILSPGRTGTKWIAAILSMDKAISAYHEAAFPIPSLLIPRQMLIGESRAIAKKILASGKHKKAVVHANGLLRVHAPEIAKHVPRLRLIYLAREGAATVGSITTKRLSRAGAQIMGRLGKDRFTSACLYFARTSAYLRSICHEVWKVEDMLNDWELFRTRTESIGVEIPKETWEVMRHKRINGNNLSYRPEHWKRSEMDKFVKLVDEENIRLGYPTRRKVENKETTDKAHVEETVDGRGIHGALGDEQSLDSSTMAQTPGEIEELR